MIDRSQNTMLNLKFGWWIVTENIVSFKDHSDHDDNLG